MSSLKILAALISGWLLTLAIVPKTLGADMMKGIAAYEKKDYGTAVREWKALAIQGDAKAQFFLGNMYYKGVGVPQDDGAASKWYKMAAEQGLIKAQNNLGTMYMRGRGISRDNLRAFMWLHITATRGDKTGIKNRDLVAKVMSLSQIKLGQERAKQCIENKYKGC